MRIACAVVLALVTTGCTLGGRAASGGDDATTATGCSGAPARPLTTAEVERVLRAHGFSASSSTTAGLCAATDASMTGDDQATAEVSNDFGGGAARDSEGWVSCTVRKGPIRGPRLRYDADAPASSPIWEGRKAEADVANVDCAIYPAEGHEDEQIAVFHDAMRALERAARAG